MISRHLPSSCFAQVCILNVHNTSCLQCFNQRRATSMVATADSTSWCAAMQSWYRSIEDSCVLRIRHNARLKVDTHPQCCHAGLTPVQATLNACVGDSNTIFCTVPRRASEASGSQSNVDIVGRDFAQRIGDGSAQSCRRNRPSGLARLTLIRSEEGILAVVRQVGGTGHQ